MKSVDDFPLYSIIQNDNADILQYWITERPHVFKNKGVADNILEMAITYNCVRVVNALLESNLKLPFKAALNLAAKSNSNIVVEWLLKAKAPVDGGLGRKDTPLYWAIRHKNMSMGCLLLDAGASLDHIEEKIAIPVYLLSYQRCLAARQLARRATERALRHARLHKDVISLVVRQVACSELERWENR